MIDSEGADALTGAELARWCYDNPNLAARTIEGLRAGDCEKIAQDCDAEMARLSGIIIDQAHEIERLRGVAQTPSARATLADIEANIRIALANIVALSDVPSAASTDREDKP